jgi:hypothetical protein
VPFPAAAAVVVDLFELLSLLLLLLLLLLPPPPKGSKLRKVRRDAGIPDPAVWFIGVVLTVFNETVDLPAVGEAATAGAEDNPGAILKLVLDAEA